MKTAEQLNDIFYYADYCQRLEGVQNLLYCPTRLTASSGDKIGYQFKMEEVCELVHKRRSNL